MSSPPTAKAKRNCFYKSALPKYPTDWSRDGRYILFGVIAPGTRSDVWAISDGGPESRTHPGYDLLGRLSRRSRRTANGWRFNPTQSGRNEVYVQAFEGATAGTKRRWLVSSGGGGLPRWRGDGAEMFYMTSGGRMMAVAVHPAGGDFQFEHGAHVVPDPSDSRGPGTSTTSPPTASGSC